MSREIFGLAIQYFTLYYAIGGNHENYPLRNNRGSAYGLQYDTLFYRKTGSGP